MLTSLVATQGFAMAPGGGDNNSGEQKKAKCAPIVFPESFRRYFHSIRPEVAPERDRAAKYEKVKVLVGNFLPGHAILDNIKDIAQAFDELDDPARLDVLSCAQILLREDMDESELSDIICSLADCKTDRSEIAAKVKNLPAHLFYAPKVITILDRCEPGDLDNLVQQSLLLIPKEWLDSVNGCQSGGTTLDWQNDPFGENLKTDPHDYTLDALANVPRDKREEIVVRTLALITARGRNVCAPSEISGIIKSVAGVDSAKWAEIWPYLQPLMHVPGPDVLPAAIEALAGIAATERDLFIHLTAQLIQSRPKPPASIFLQGNSDSLSFVIQQLSLVPHEERADFFRLAVLLTEKKMLYDTMEIHSFAGFSIWEVLRLIPHEERAEMVDLVLGFNVEAVGQITRLLCLVNVADRRNIATLLKPLAAVSLAGCLVEEAIIALANIQDPEERAEFVAMTEQLTQQLLRSGAMELHCAPMLDALARHDRPQRKIFLALAAQLERPFITNAHPVRGDGYTQEVFVNPIDALCRLNPAEFIELTQLVAPDDHPDGIAAVVQAFAGCRSGNREGLVELTRKFMNPEAPMPLVHVAHIMGTLSRIGIYEGVEFLEWTGGVCLRNRPSNQICDVLRLMQMNMYPAHGFISAAQRAETVEKASLFLASFSYNFDELRDALAGSIEDLRARINLREVNG